MIDPLDLRSFPPVEPLSATPATYRQTLLSKYVECPRSGYLYVKYNGGALTHPLAGGTILHRAIERFIRELLKENERIGVPERAKDILNEVLVESTDLTVSPDRFDSMRAMIFHLAEGLAITPSNVVCLETPVSVEIAGHTITGTIDFAEADPYELLIRDWKSAFYTAAKPDVDPDDEEYVPTKEEWPGTFQLVLYAYALATGSIKGAPEGFNFGETAKFRLRQDHPRQFWVNEGEIAYREAVIDRDTLLDWRLYLESVVSQMAAAFDTWQFPAVLGSHCDFCPASAECPIPAPLRDFRGEIRTPEDAARAAIRRERHKAIAEQLWEGIKGFAKDKSQRIRYGRDLELYWKKQEIESVKDKVEVQEGKKVKGKQALRQAVEAANEVHAHIDWDHYHTKSVSTRLTRRKLSPRQLAKESGHIPQQKEEK